MPPVPVRQIPRPPSSRAASKPRTLHVSPASPEYEYDYMTGDLGDPAAEVIGWNPIGAIADVAAAGVDILKKAGRSIITAVTSGATALGSTVYAAATGEPPAEPGVVFNIATGMAEGVNRLLPQTVQQKLGTENKTNVAGYITLPDGRKIPVPKAEDAQGTAERALSAAVRGATIQAQAAIAEAKIKADVERLKLQASTDQWQKSFALTERAAGQRERLTDLQIRAAELALERETASPAQRALWGRPSTLAPQQAETTRAVRAIGPGVPGGVITGKPAWTLPW